ncbi:hypothetical protein ES705_28966 [subsurface metagenome]
MIKYWKRIDSEGNTTTVESYSHNLAVEGAVEIDKKEFDAFISSLPEPEPPEPVRDYGKEIDAMNERLKVVEKK